MPRVTRYEMEWQNLHDHHCDSFSNKPLACSCSLPGLRLTRNEDYYVMQRLLGSSAHEAARILNFSNRYLWDLKRQIARRFPDHLAPGNRGLASAPIRDAHAVPGVTRPDIFATK